MPRVVNFLPWRRLRRQRSARRWGTAFLLTALVMVAFGITQQRLAALSIHRAALWQQSDGAIAVALVGAEKSLQLRAQERQQAQARMQRQQRTLAWRQTLLTLAELLPSQAWLTGLRWQQNRLTLSGLAGTFNALRELERQLHGVAGFRLQQSGAIARDPHGRWRFDYHLTRDADDAL